MKLEVDFDGLENPDLLRQEAWEDWWHALQLLGAVAVVVSSGLLAFFLFTWGLVSSIWWLKAHL